MTEPSSSERFDFGALRERRAFTIYPVVLIGGALPFLVHAGEVYWADASVVA